MFSVSVTEEPYSLVTAALRLSRGCLRLLWDTSLRVCHRWSYRCTTKRRILRLNKYWSYRSRFDSGIRVTPSFCLRRILPKKHNHLKMLVNSLISSKFQVPDSPRVVPEAGLMKPCPQEHMTPIGSISPGAIAHDRLGSARRVTNSQLVRERGGFQAAQGRNEYATSTNTANRASLPIQSRF